MRARLGVLLLSVVLTGCAPPAPGQTAPTQAPIASGKIGYPSLGGNLMALWTAQDAGLFARYGLTSEADYIAGSRSSSTRTYWMELNEDLLDGAPGTRPPALSASRPHRPGLAI